MQRLAELFNVNHFIVSQVVLAVALQPEPFLQHKHARLFAIRCSLFDAPFCCAHPRSTRTCFPACGGAARSHRLLMASLLRCVLILCYPCKSSQFVILLCSRSPPSFSTASALHLPCFSREPLCPCLPFYAQVLHRLDQLIALNIAPHVCRSIKTILAQRYVGHITIVPNIALSDFLGSVLLSRCCDLSCLGVISP